MGAIEIIVIVAAAAIVIGVITARVVARKKGKPSCGCDCCDCCSSCRKKTENKQ